MIAINHLLRICQSASKIIDLREKYKISAGQKRKNKLLFKTCRILMQENLDNGGENHMLKYESICWHLLLVIKIFFQL